MFRGQNFDIVYEDEWMIAINKPWGILVHRTSISEDTEFVLQLLRNQIKQRVYPIHRLDRATSGVLLFSKSKAMASLLGGQFREQQVQKKYLAIVRGFVAEEDAIDYALQSDPHKAKQEAITHFQKIAQTTYPAAISRYPNSRYSLVKITPLTGRQHQIRKHFAHIHHPIIGDKKHGDCKHNKYFREVLAVPRMLLHAQSLSFQHPHRQAILQLEAPMDTLFEKAMQLLTFSKDVAT
ncbi:MAG: pseudouridine synthase [Bacteroidota bacterium]